MSKTMCSWVSPTRHNKKTTFRKINRCTQKLSKHPWGDAVELKKKIKKEKRKRKKERKKKKGLIKQTGEKEAVMF